MAIAAAVAKVVVNNRHNPKGKDRVKAAAPAKVVVRVKDNRRAATAARTGDGGNSARPVSRKLNLRRKLRHQRRCRDSHSRGSSVLTAVAVPTATAAAPTFKGRVGGTAAGK